MEVKDNFLDEAHLIQLDELINSPHFVWYFMESQVKGAVDGCWFCHLIYAIDEPKSNLCRPLTDIFKNKLEYVSLCKITVNLLPKQKTPSISDFHTDFGHDINILDETKITTAIFYLNTNNGVTEFKDGDRIDSVRNRLIMFPTITPHRAIGPTDVAERIVLNFNFIKSENVTI